MRRRIVENTFYARLLEQLRRATELLSAEGASRSAQVQPELVRAHTEIGTLTEDVARLSSENQFYTQRLRELEKHNRALTEAATARAQKVQDQQHELERLHIEIAELSPEVTRLTGENNHYTRRLSELEKHNRVLTEAATERAQKVQDQQHELERLLIAIATLSPEVARLASENSFYARRLAELEGHNQSLTKAATERAQRVHDLEQQLYESAGRIAAPSVAPNTGYDCTDGQDCSPLLPSIMVVSIPKSGTVFTRTMLMRGLGLQPLTVSVGAFPHYSLDVRKLRRFQEGGVIVSSHLDASAENLQFLSAFVNRWVVHVRDPRSVLLSWVHHLQRLYEARHADINELLLVCPTPPEALFERDFSEQLDWNIENFLPSVVSWTRRWLAMYDSRVNNVLLTSYSDLVKGEEEFLLKILEFYGVSRGLFKKIPLERTIDASHFRTGRTDEWRDSLTSSQISRATEIIGDDLLARFEWPSA
jgi:predicted nuclease with TOPRIM domain